jgi:hypothetical protein
MRRQQFQRLAPTFDALFRKKRDSVERERNASKYRRLRAGTLLSVDKRRRGVDGRRNYLDARKSFALVFPVFLDCQDAGFEKPVHLFREIPLCIPVALVSWELGEDRGRRIGKSYLEIAGDNPRTGVAVGCQAASASSGSGSGSTSLATTALMAATASLRSLKLMAPSRSRPSLRMA